MIDNLTTHEIDPQDKERTDLLLEKFVKLFPEYAFNAPQIRDSITQGRDLNPKVIPHHWIIEHSGKPIGFILFNYIIESNFGFCRYIGVDPDSRTGDIGYTMSIRSLQQIAVDAAELGRPQPIGLCSEAERPELAKTEKRSQACTYRMDYFLQDCRAVELNVDYLEPPSINPADDPKQLQQSQGNPMHLLFYSLQGDKIPTLEETRTIVHGLYTGHYLLDENSDFVQGVLKTIGRSTHLYHGGGE